jgi:hypothetical protein
MADLGMNDPLHDAVGAVETQLERLGDALRRRDAAALDASASHLHAALAAAVDAFGAAAGAGGRVPEPLRHRLALAGAEVAAHRESLARATAALDRAIDVLLPRDPAAGSYGVDGRHEHARLGHLTA